MTKTVLLIDHPVGKRDDRASQWLLDRGYRLAWVRPADGEPLPDPNAEYAAVIVYGGAESVNDAAEESYLQDEIDWLARWLATDKPCLGLCLGGQLMARALGAAVRPHPEGLHEIGYVPITPAAGDFVDGLTHVYHWHNEGFDLPDGARLLATGQTFPHQAFAYGRNAYALQFHPEVSIAVMCRWMESAGHMLERKGAHPRERQLADAETYDAPLAAWFDGFLARWLDDAGGGPE